MIRGSGRQLTDFKEIPVNGYALKQWLQWKFIHQKKGFTLAELVVAITVMGIFTGAITVSVDQANRNTRLSNAATRGLADLRFSQEMAMTHRREVNFTVNIGDESFHAKYNDTGSYLPSSLDGQDLIVQFDDGQYTDVEITSSEVTGNRLSFNTMGKPLLNGADLPADEMSVMFLNNKIHVIIVSSGYAYLAETVGGGGCGGGC